MKKILEKNLNPYVVIGVMAAAGVDPRIMEYRTVPTNKKLLKSTGIPLHKIVIIKLNEAFAAQAFTITSKLNLKDDDKLINPNGAILGIL